MSPPPKRPTHQRSASAEALAPFNAPYLRYPDDCPPLHRRTVSLSRHDGPFNDKILRFMAQDLLEEERQDEMAWWRKDGRRLLEISRAAEGEIQAEKAGVVEQVFCARVTVPVDMERVRVAEEIAVLEEAAACKESTPVTTEPFPVLEDLEPLPEDSQEPADATIEVLPDPPTDTTNYDLVVAFLIVFIGILIVPVLP